MPAEQPIHVADAVRFLDAFAGDTLGALRRAHPDPSAQAALQPEGAVLGGGDAALAAAVATAAAFLDEIDETALAAIRKTRRRLRHANYAEFVGRLLALASTGSLVAVLLGNAAPGLSALALAAIGFLAAALPLAVALMRGSLTDPSGLGKHYTALGDASFEARLLRARLDAARLAQPPDPAALTGLTDEVNALARTMNRILNDLGYDPRPADG
jgi:hypothetical protein